MKNIVTIAVIYAQLLSYAHTESISLKCEDHISVISKQYACSDKHKGVLGKGVGGAVFLIQDIRSKELFAYKVSNTANNFFRLEKTQFYDKLAQEPNIAKRYFAKNLDGKTYEVFEYCENGTLNKYISRFNMRTDQDKILAIFMKIVKAVAKVHAIGWLHRDIKPENIVVDSEGEPKLIDFHTSHLLDQAQTYDGQPEICAPEALEARMEHDMIEMNVSMDAWSLGILLYSMLYGTDPFSMDKNVLLVGMRELLWATKGLMSSLIDFYKERKITVKKGSSVQVVRIILMMLKHNPKDRKNLSLVLDEIEKALENRDKWAYITRNMKINIDEDFDPADVSYVQGKSSGSKVYRSEAKIMPILLKKDDGNLN